MSALTKEMMEEILKNWNALADKTEPFEFVLPSEITEIDKDAFLPMGYVQNMVLKTQSSGFIVENNCLFARENGRLYFGICGSDEILKIPAEVKEINLYAFPDCVQQIEVPAAVPEIPVKAAKSARLKKIIEDRNQKVRAKKEKIQAILKLKK